MGIWLNGQIKKHEPQQKKGPQIKNFDFKIDFTSYYILILTVSSLYHNVGVQPIVDFIGDFKRIFFFFAVDISI